MNNSDFPDGTIRLVESEDSPKEFNTGIDKASSIDTEELEKRFCTLCGMPFTVHPILEQHVVFCNFCTMHDIRSI